MHSSVIIGNDPSPRVDFRNFPSPRRQPRTRKISEIRPRMRVISYKYLAQRDICPKLDMWNKISWNFLVTNLFRHMKFFNNERILNGKNSKFEKLIKSYLKQLKLSPVPDRNCSTVPYHSRLCIRWASKIREKREQVRLNNPQILTQDFNVCSQFLFNAFWIFSGMS